MLRDRETRRREIAQEVLALEAALRAKSAELSEADAWEMHLEAQAEELVALLHECTEAELSHPGGPRCTALRKRIALLVAAVRKRHMGNG